MRIEGIAAVLTSAPLANLKIQPRPGREPDPGNRVSELRTATGAILVPEAIRHQMRMSKESADDCGKFLAHVHFFLGRPGHSLKWVRISLLVSRAPHPQPQGMRVVDPAGRPGCFFAGFAAMF